MNTTTSQTALRDGNAAKRAAILVAARELFLRDGTERVSMDAVAAEAKVSKRTVYDYFGDKHRLLLSVVKAAVTTMVGSFRAAIARHLSDDAAIGTVADLEAALLAFALELGTTVIAAADYATVAALTFRAPEIVEELSTDPLKDEPEDAMAERLAHFAELGLLELSDPHRAADHFSALTILLTYDTYPDPAKLDADEVARIMAAGVGAFVRAYGRRD